MSIQESKSPLQLEGTTREGSHWVIPISSSPFLIGRKEGCNLHLSVDGISRIHAEIREKDVGWWIVDCGSTNGTFVNHRRLTGEQLIKSGDILQFADMHFTVTEPTHITQSTRIINPHAQKFESMMMEKAVDPYFQPILRFSDLATVGYEILGRVHYGGLPELPGPLFQIAKKLDREIELSQLFRDQAFARANRLNVRDILFFNMLPAEVDTNLIACSLGHLRKAFPSLHLAMELHESVITDAPMVKKLRRVLKELGIFLVYDDFGSGQARLVELMEAPPDVIKFDFSLIHGIETRTETSQAIVAALVKMAKGAGIRTLAEGVETQGEADVCKQLGFDLAQGYYFGKPGPLTAPATDKRLDSSGDKA
ncbi:MAG: EAL domain-containing protein [Methylococcaceae bacterium]|nr:EAL domain-containing protein [Methylococcaceae bacterium]